VKYDPDISEEWEAHPMTEALVRTCDVLIERARDAWIGASLDGGVSDPMKLAQVRERIAVYREIRNMLKAPQVMIEVLNG